MLQPKLRQAQAYRVNSVTDTSSHPILILRSRPLGQGEPALSSRVASAGSWRVVMMIARLLLAVPLEATFSDDPKMRIYVLYLRSMTSI